MSLLEPQQAPERRLSPGLSVDLPTNNPFRKGASSPALPLPLNTPPERPSSRNPFLDQGSEMASGGAQQKPMSPVRAVNGRAPPPPRQAGSAETGDLLSGLSIHGQSNTNENVPPPTNSRNVHRPSRSQEEQYRLRNGGKPRGSEQVLDIFADPIQEGKAYDRRPRRNSDSSVVDRNGKPSDPEEDRRRRERRNRERDPRQRDSKGRPIPSSSGVRGKNQPPSHRLDIIDKLDVTSIYGTGLFHHDGPFDACNPHRNRKGAARAPMQAFPKDSANSVIGGSGPVNKNIDIAQFHGHGAEGFTDFSASGTKGAATLYEPYAGANIPFRGDARPGVDRTSSFNATTKADLVHGDVSMGLGSSTFLEGAPAPRVAIQRRESEGEFANGGGLGRKKSLAQKIRGIKRDSGPRPLASPEPKYEATTSPVQTPAAGGLSAVREINPFFNDDYGAAYDKKGATIKAAEEQNKGAEEGSARRRAPSSPMRPAAGVNVLERQITNEAPSEPPQPDGEGKTSGFMSRVKSLRGGGRKPRTERRETSG